MMSSLAYFVAVSWLARIRTCCVVADLWQNRGAGVSSLYCHCCGEAKVSYRAIANAFGLCRRMKVVKGKDVSTQLVVRAVLQEKQRHVLLFNGRRYDCLAQAASLTADMFHDVAAKRQGSLSSKARCGRRLTKLPDDARIAEGRARLGESSLARCGPVRSAAQYKSLRSLALLFDNLIKTLSASHDMHQAHTAALVVAEHSKVYVASLYGGVVL